MKQIVLAVSCALLAASACHSALAQSPSTSPWRWQRFAGNPVMVPESVPSRPGASYFAIGDPSLMYSDGKFKMWFGYGGLDDINDPKSVRVRTAYAESDDAVNWRITAPALDAGSGWDRTNAETPVVLKDDSLPDGHPRKYRLYYSGLDNAFLTLPLDQVLQLGMLYGIGLAFSPDGKSFTRLPASESPYGIEGLVLKPNPPVVDQDAWDFINVADPHVVKKDGRYYLWYSSQGRIARDNKTFIAISFAVSDDGIRWQKLGNVLKAELPWELQSRTPNVGRPYVLWRDDHFEMFYDAVKDDDNPDQNTVAAMGFAWSIDGATWQKQPSPIFAGNNGNGERKGIIVGSGFLLKDDTYYMVYAGADPEWSHWKFNLATSPGFGSPLSQPIAFSVTDRGIFTRRTAGTSGTAAGYGRMQSDSTSPTPSGLAIFGLRQNGVLVSEAGVPASPLMQSGRIYAEVNGPVNTGVAIANPNNQPAIISYFFTDAAGRNFGQGTMTVDANGQIAKFLSDPPFNSGSIVTGTFTFTASIPISAIALRGFTNQRSEFLMTTLPVADLATSSSSTTVAFPHFADGGGWKTQVVLVNGSDDTLTGTLQFFDQGTATTAAAPVTLTINGRTGSSFMYSIAPRSSSRLQTGGFGGSTVSGSVRLSPAAGTKSPSGLVIFSYTTGGITVSEAGVPASAAGAAFRMYAESAGFTGQAGTIQTGLAIANIGTTPATVNLELSTLTGVSVSAISVTVPASGQIAKLLGELFPDLGAFQGALRISSTSPIAVTGLRGRYNERSEFLVTTTPPATEAASSPNAELIFPHFVDGAGYTTQFIVLNKAPSQSSSGTLRFFSQSGQPLSLMLR